MLLLHGTVIALLDAHNFTLYRNVGDEAQPELVEMVSPKLDLHNHSGASHHSAAHVAEDVHAIAAVDWLNTQVLGNKIEHLVVVATPRTLGEARKHYHKVLERVLQAEIAKDLIGKKPADVLAALRDRK
jgi:protein required for attachment to host cells